MSTDHPDEPPTFFNDELDDDELSKLPEMLTPTKASKSINLLQFTLLKDRDCRRLKPIDGYRGAKHNVTHVCKHCDACIF